MVPLRFLWLAKALEYVLGATQRPLSGAIAGLESSLFTMLTTSGQPKGICVPVPGISIVVVDKGSSSALT
ncbi:hypothetical protein CUR178_05951 [Leishmania enriettii]|uniref:Uncharacterized protein n=1 Tax=Leishmania enriettii TaxID=5663 RepID=A0A836GZP1_LEIEN|nr:hypothetical protein CUR178_05951 [Leishmania enriettii]